MGSKRRTGAVVAVMAQRPTTTTAVIWVSMLACILALSWREEWFDSVYVGSVCLVASLVDGGGDCCEE